MQRWQQKLGMLIRERKWSQEANCFPKCRFKGLSDGSVSPMRVSPVAQSTQDRACWPTHLSVLQLPRHSFVPARRTGAGNRSGWKKSVLKHPPKSNMFFFPSRITSPIWPGAQLHKQRGRGSVGCVGWRGRHRPSKRSSKGKGAPKGKELQRERSSSPHRDPQWAFGCPAPLPHPAGPQRQPGCPREGTCSDTRGKQGHSRWFAPLNSSWKAG